MTPSWSLIEVKARIAGPTDVIVTRDAVLEGNERGDDHVLALAEVHPDGPDRDRVRSLVGPFADTSDPGFSVTAPVSNGGRFTGSGSDAC